MMNQRRIRNVNCRYLNVLDVEATCWKEGQDVSQQEVIQIGICQVELHRQVISDPDSFLIKPVYEHTEITEFCTKLTGITLADLKCDGQHFPLVMEILDDEYNIYERPFASWGFYDMNILQREYSEKMGDPKGNPFVPYKHRNIQHDYALFGDMKNSRKSLKSAMRNCNLEFEGEHHNAKWDAYNTARILVASINKSG